MPKDIKPASLNSITIAKPFIGPLVRADAQTTRFLEQNISCVHSFYGGAILRSYIHGSQPSTFSYPDIRRVFVKVHPSSHDPSAQRATTPWYQQNIYVPLEVTRLDDDTVTELPEYLLEKMDIVSLPKLSLLVGAPGDPLTWPADSSEVLARGRGQSRLDGLNILQQSLYTETIGSFSFLGQLPEKTQQELLSTLPSKMMGIKVLNFFKGKSQPHYCITEVTRKQVANGTAFFLFKTPATILDSMTTTTSTMNVVCLGSMWSPDKIKKFKKARRNIVEMLSTLNTRPQKLLDPVGYDALAQAKLGDFCKFWGGIADIIQPEAVPDTFSAPDYDQVALALQGKTYIDNTSYKALGAHDHMSKTPEGKKLKRASIAVSSASDSVEQTEFKKSKAQSLAKAAQKDTLKEQEQLQAFMTWVQKCEASIQELQEAEESYKREADEIEKQIEALQEGLAKLNESHKVAREAYTQKLTEYLEDSGNNKDVFTNMLKSGILIKEIILRHVSNGKRAPLQDNLHLVGDPDWRFAQVVLLTTRPTPIYVDRLDQGENADVVYGGPYMMYITSSGEDQKVRMDIRLASLNSVFGFQPFDGRFKAKAHPHCPPQDVYPNTDSIINFIDEQWPTCLGDAESTIQEGFKSHNVKMVIAGALSWLSSANSDDQWGANWWWFPREEDVDPEGNWTLKEKPEELDVDASLAQMQTMLTSTSTISTHTNSPTIA